MWKPKRATKKTFSKLPKKKNQNSRESREKLFKIEKAFSE